MPNKHKTSLCLWGVLIDDSCDEVLLMDSSAPCPLFRSEVEKEPLL